MSPLDRLTQFAEPMINLRRYFHQYPELSLEEFQTTQYIADFFEELGLTPKLLEPTGLVVDLQIDDKKPYLLLRANIDGVYMTELNDHLDYQAVDQVAMHANGHDAQMAALMYVAKTLLEYKEQLAMNIRFLFQPSSEAAGGAQLMIDQNVLSNVELIFGLNWDPSHNTGAMALPKGLTYGRTAMFEATFGGDASAVAHPEQGVDTSIMAAQFILACQSVNTRTIGPSTPSLITIGTAEIGERWNSIPFKATLSGVVRTFDEYADEEISRTLARQAKSIATMQEGLQTFDYTPINEAVVIDEEIVNHIKEELQSKLTDVNWFEAKPALESEDFGAYLQEVPGFMGIVGMGNHEIDTTFSAYNPHYQMDEAAIMSGAQLYLLVAMHDWLNDLR